MTGQIFATELKEINEFEGFINLPNHGFERIEFDSRSITNPSNTLFVCLKGINKDGHDFIAELIKDGVKNFIVSDKNYINEKANFYLSENTVSGFQALAKHIRNKFKNVVIGITGSNGKTIVKEWLAQLLSVKYSVAKSPKSFNSQIGVPYSISQLKKEDLAIIECGISKPGEMLNLEHCVTPDWGIFTNIGDAHSAGFNTIEEKIAEKAKLFSQTKKIICKDEIAERLSLHINRKRLVTWGQEGDYTVEYSSQENQTLIKINNTDFVAQLNDTASLENITHCLVFGLEYGLTMPEIQYGLNLLKPIPMRLEIKQGFNQNLILNDSYNNDISGLKHAIDQAKRIDQTKKRTLILSELVQYTPDKNNLEKELLELVNSLDLEQTILVGKGLKSFSKKDPNFIFFETSDEVINHLKKNRKTNHFYILKGAREHRFERLVDVLEQKQHITKIEVNLSILINNLSHYRRLLKTQTKLMVMVKAFAYGTSIVEVAKLLEIQRVDYLAVAYTDEGIVLREAGIKTPIMIMNPTLEDTDSLLIYDLEPEVYSIEQLHQFSRFPQLKLHLKLDTGMHRLGFDKNSFPDLTAFLLENKNTNVASCLTHLAGADEEKHDNYTYQQLELFRKMTSEIAQIIPQKFIKHALNSAGIERHNEYQLDMVRLGIGLYGFGGDKNLKSCLTLKTTISQIRQLEPGETVGYGRQGKIKKPTKVATLPIGYADGFDRRFSQGVGSVLIHGKEAFVIGNVCMDMTMVDVTEIDCHTGDEVIIYNETHNISKLAKRIGTISYELLTHLSERVRRIFYFD